MVCQNEPVTFTSFSPILIYTVLTANCNHMLLIQGIFAKKHLIASVVATFVE